MVRRVLPFLEELKRCGHDKAAVVTHGGVIRSITAWILGMKLAEWRLLGSDLENSSITELSYDNVHDRFRLERFNDYAHLEKFPELLRENWKEDKE
ncbi:histidine phosphatase family protein [Clostridium sp. AM58-1XD]|uniref:histidine phosphatase family protein n=1 Tax=Clostridium sp. AM58-1XD TaxID=2292307 RepID=UPI0026D7EFF7